MQLNVKLLGAVPPGLTSSSFSTATEPSEPTSTVSIHVDSAEVTIDSVKKQSLEQLGISASAVEAAEVEVKLLFQGKTLHGMKTRSFVTTNPIPV